MTCTGLNHPGAQCLTGNPQVVAFLKLLGRERRAKIGIMLADQGHGMLAQDIRQAIVGGAAATPIRDPSRTVIPKAPHQAIDLTLTDLQQRCGHHRGETAALEAGQDIDPVEFSFAHQHHAHQICRLRSPIPKGRRLTF